MVNSIITMVETIKMETNVRVFRKIRIGFEGTGASFVLTTG